MADDREGLEEAPPRERSSTDATSVPGSRGSAEGGPRDVVLWGLVLYAACRGLELLLEAQAMAASVGQAVLVEWGCSRLGIFWSDPAASPTTAQIARRAGIGIAVGLVLAGAVTGLLAATNGVRLESVSRVEVSILVIGLIGAGITAWRDELLLRGIVLKALAPERVSTLIRILACAATSGGAALGRSDATPRTVVVAVLLGVVFGALWCRDRGAWQAWAANTTLRFTTTTLLSGGIYQSRVADDAWGGAASGMLGGTGAVLALAPLSVFALVWTTRTGWPRAARVG